MRSLKTSDGGAGQLDLFVGAGSDIAARDAQDLMAWPFFSLAKTKRVKPIDFRMGEVAILVEATAEHGMATIWDADVLIWVASQIVEPFTTLPQVDPGAQILLSVRSWPKVRQVFALIDAIEDVGIDPCDVAPDHWHHVHNRLAGGMQVRSYSPARHRDWLRRRKLQS
ncbi:DUF2840 domain-containing protein [Qipengyuania sp. MTN3-11]|uniref:DUF2840 domain-containing protein n=1 Tax=Qipengyuania sp. MTN3-11 TaxID=3056557 RepID=UPI0036F23A42